MIKIFTKIISTVISIAIIIGMALFGYIIFQEFNNKMQETFEPEEFKSEFSVSSKGTVDDSIKTPQIKENVFSGVESTGNNQNTNVNYDTIQVNKYFYDQLEEEAKYIYKAFESNKEDMKTGRQKIELGNYFSSLLNSSNGDKKVGEYYQSAIEAYTYDNPDVFYLSPNKMYLNIETTTSSAGKSYRLYIDQGDENNYLIDEFSSSQQVNSALSQIEQVKNSILQNRTGDTYKDIKMVHDYLIDTISYDESISKDNIYNMYGALINRVCVCEGYARSFKYILESMNIPCVIVVGTGTNSSGKTENHAWNYVQYNGQWYAVDVTWDDPIVIGGGKASSENRTKYFMKGASEFNKMHTPSTQFTPGGKVFKYPTIVQ